MILKQILTIKSGPRGLSQYKDTISLPVYEFLIIDKMVS